MYYYKCSKNGHNCATYAIGKKKKQKRQFLKIRLHINEFNWVICISWHKLAHHSNLKMR